MAKRQWCNSAQNALREAKTFAKRYNEGLGAGRGAGSEQERLSCEKTISLLILWSVICTATLAADNEDVLVIVQEAPGDRILTLPISAEQVHALVGDRNAVSSWAPKAVAQPTKEGPRWLPFQFDREDDESGWLSVMLPDGFQRGNLRVAFGDQEARAEESIDYSPVVVRSEEGSGIVDNGFARVVHDPKNQGGLPGVFSINATGHTFQDFRINDRVHDPELGSFSIRNDPEQSTTGYRSRVQQGMCSADCLAIASP